MSWKDLLGEEVTKALPWFGFRKVHDSKRTWTIKGRVPDEYGWYYFDVGPGRYCKLSVAGKADPDYDYAEGQWMHTGYLVGNHLIPDSASVDTDPARFVEQARRVHCVSSGLDRITRARVVADRMGHLVYLLQEFPLGPEAAVMEAYLNRMPNVNHIPDVIPSLDLAFRWISHRRELMEERRRELEALREQEEKRRAALRNVGTSVGRRVIAATDFNLAATEALKVSGAEFLDARDSAVAGEKVVQYRFRLQRFECVVDRHTLRVVDAGICLTDESTGERGDTFFTLESLPGVIAEAIDRDRLVVYRHLR